MKGRVTRGMLGVLSISLMLSGCMSDARREIEADRVKAHAEPLELSGPKRAPVAHIDTDGSLAVGHEWVALDASQRAATLAYRAAALRVIDMSLTSAEKYVHSAIPRFLFASALHMGTDAGTKSMEKGAEKMVHSPPFCDAMETMREKQDVMVAELPQLRPYTHVTTGDIQDCRAGRG